ncbi:hypothetical protein F5Y10DRAFT_125066 [Nemania abortiva]|nr:hypothetical protein F5Y10DRAFT_125066 [Nemania abortiva]
MPTSPSSPRCPSLVLLKTRIYLLNSLLYLVSSLSQLSHGLSTLGPAIHQVEGAWYGCWKAKVTAVATPLLNNEGLLKPLHNVQGCSDHTLCFRTLILRAVYSSRRLSFSIE